MISKYIKLDKFYIVNRYVFHNKNYIKKEKELYPENIFELNSHQF